MIGTYLRAANRFRSRLRESRAFGIVPTDLVLDLGSGQDPHPRANVLCDKFVSDTSERSCGAGLVIDRALVLADATATPFPDKSFDFVFCAHLLEHMEDPAALLTELMRISRRGYIETPSKIYEKVSGWDFHHWFVSLENGKLILERKDEAIFDQDLNAWFDRRLADPEFSAFLMPRLHDFELLTAFVWEDSISFEVRDPLGRPTPGVSGAVELDIDSINLTLTSAQRVKAELGRRQRRASDERVPELLARLNCPVCSAELRLSSTSRTCSGCGRVYPISGDIHIALPELASLGG